MRAKPFGGPYLNEMAASIHEKLAAFEPSKSTKYDPGKIIVLFDDRLVKSDADQFSSFQSYWTEGLYRLGWPSVRTPDLDPGNVRLVWYTVSHNSSPSLDVLRDH